VNLNELLKLMTEKEASDLHLKPMRPPLLRIFGKLMPIESEALKPVEIEQMLLSILSPRQKQRLEEKLAVDLGYGVPGLARFRGNVYMQRGTLAGAFRRIPMKIKEIESLELPQVLLDFCDIPMGLVLITGPTGSGKSTTLAALIKHIVSRRPAHVITIEDPIEFLFSDDVAAVSQREIGTDSYGFAEALRNSLRQDPDVVMVGEMRDKETVSTVITAAETGHLVFSTLHTNNAPQTIDRILDTFPAEQQPQIRSQLAQVMKGVATMKLVERQDGSGLIAAVEILKASPKVAHAIEKGETSSLMEEIESSVGYYRMQTMNQSLLALLVNGVITYAEAMRQSNDPEDLSLKLRKMFPGIEERGDNMAHSPADFSEIVELQQYRKLYEEQEEKFRLRIAEKDEHIADVETSMRTRDDQIRDLQNKMREGGKEIERMKSDYQRLRQEAQDKIDKLMERIRDLNQRLMTPK
jgi:twitching motility protein PilT